MLPLSLSRTRRDRRHAAPGEEHGQWALTAQPGRDARAHHGPPGGCRTWRGWSVQPAVARPSFRLDCLAPLQGADPVVGPSVPEVFAALRPPATVWHPSGMPHRVRGADGGCWGDDPGGTPGPPSAPGRWPPAGTDGATTRSTAVPAVLPVRGRDRAALAPLQGAGPARRRRTRRLTAPAPGRSWARNGPGSAGARPACPLSCGTPPAPESLPEVQGEPPAGRPRPVAPPAARADGARQP